MDFIWQGISQLLPEWYKNDAVDDVELFQDAGHAGGRKLGNGKQSEPIWWATSRSGLEGT